MHLLRPSWHEADASERPGRSEHRIKSLRAVEQAQAAMIEPTELNRLLRHRNDVLRTVLGEPMPRRDLADARDGTEVCIDPGEGAAATGLVVNESPASRCWARDVFDAQVDAAEPVTHDHRVAPRPSSRCRGRLRTTGTRRR